MLTKDFHGLTMSKYPKVSIVILNYNGKKIISECVDAALQSSYPNIELVIVDNCSFDGSQSYLRQRYGKRNKIRLVFSQINLQFAGGFNLGVQKSRGELVFLVSNDVIVESKCITELVEIASQNSKYLVQPKIISYQNKKVLDNAGGHYSIWGTGKGMGGGTQDEGQFDKDRVVDFVAATTFMMNRKFYLQLGGYDKWFVSHYEDVDLCLRARSKGAVCWYSYKSRCNHKISFTYKKYVAAETVLLNVRKNRICVVLKNFNGLEKLIRLFLLLPVNIFTTVQDLLSSEATRKTVTLRAVYAAFIKK